MIHDLDISWVGDALLPGADLHPLRQPGGRGCPLGVRSAGSKGGRRSRRATAAANASSPAADASSPAAPRGPPPAASYQSGPRAARTDARATAAPRPGIAGIARCPVSLRSSPSS